MALACARDAPRNDARGPDLRSELLARVQEDQAVREAVAAELRAGRVPGSELIAQMHATDSANVAWLKGVVAQSGWPMPEQVGADGVNAAFLLLQHADADPAFQERMLPVLDSAYAAGQIDGESVALLTDRVARAKGEPQCYGTQASIVDGRLVVDPIEDSLHVDERRARMGLLPLARYLQLLDSVYAPGTQR